MALLHLPPELLGLIFDELGSSFFHEDLGRLTVCKLWLEFALPTYLKWLRLTQMTLQSLMTSWVMKRPSLLHNQLETLDLDLRGVRPYFQEWTLKAGIVVDITRLFEDAREAAPKNLEQLAMITQKSHRLHTLRMRVEGYGYQSSRYHLPLPTMQALLSVDNLRVLVLDLPSGLLNSSGQEENDTHICPAIGALLCTLQTLRLRMRSICPDVLRSRGPNDRLQLSEVVINLSLIEYLPRGRTASESKRCGSQSGGFLHQLRADLCEQAEALVAQMAFPEVVTILIPSPRLWDLESLDILTGESMVLEGSIAWVQDDYTIEKGPENGSENSF